MARLPRPKIPVLPQAAPSTPTRIALDERLVRDLLGLGEDAVTASVAKATLPPSLRTLHPRLQKPDNSDLRNIEALHTPISIALALLNEVDVKKAK